MSGQSFSATPTPYLRFGMAVAPTPRFRIRADVLASVIVQGTSIQIAEQEVATWGRPVALFAADLAARGRVLPILVPGEDGYAARWRPVLAAADAQPARELATAMPPLCRAAEDAPAGTSLADMLDSFADSTVRTRLQAPLLPARRGRRPAHIDLTERTVAALTTSDARITVETPQDAAEARALTTSLAAWLAAAHLAAGPVRTCFRLVEPDENEDPEEPGEGGDREFLAIEGDFLAEAAANIRTDHRHLRFGQVEAARHVRA